MSRLHSYTLRRIIYRIGIVLVSLVVIAAIGLLFVRLFSIDRIEVDGDGVSIELDKEKLGNNLLLVPADRLTKDLLSAYPLLSSVRFEKRLPGTLGIHLTKRQPFVLIVTDRGMYVLDKEGVVLDNAASKDGYPVFRFDVGSLSIGSRVVDTRVSSSLAFLNAMPDASVISLVREKDSASILAIMGNTNIVFPQTGDVRVKADTLQTIIEGFRIRGTLPAVIDLRFDKPIVTN